MDSGIGIPRDKHDQIFDKFIQADGSMTRKFGGSGLGTSIAKELTEIMGGAIGFRSVEGIGSDFHFSVEHLLHELPLLHKKVDEVNHSY